MPPVIPYQFLLASERSENAEKFLHAFDKHITMNPTFQYLFPEIQPGTPWNRKVRNLKRSFDPTLKEFTFESAGLNSDPTSTHYTDIIGDDLTGFSNCETPEGRDSVERWWTATNPLLMPDGRRILVMTRWHYDDIAGRVILLNPTLPVTEQYYIENHGCYEWYETEEEHGPSTFPTIWPDDKLSAERIHQGDVRFSCNPYEAPILMADWSVKPIGEVEIGDEVVGFTIGKGKREGRLVPARVLAVNSRTALTQNVRLQSGRTIRCTPEHNWFTGRLDATHKLYLPAHIGGALMEVVNTDPDGKDYGYLAGIIDGEGTCGQGSIRIAQSPTANPDVYARILQELNILGIQYGFENYTYVDKRIGMNSARSVNHVIWLRGGRQTYFNVLKGNPGKRSRMCKAIYAKGAKFLRRKDKVLSLEADKWEEVFALTTTTGNYVAWGYASQNSWMLNDPKAPETRYFEWDKVAYWTKDKEFDEMLPQATKAMIVDPASGLDAHHDYTGIVIAACHGNNRWVTRTEQGRWSWLDLIAQVKVLCRTHQVSRLGVEAVAQGSAIMEFFMAEYRKGGMPFPERLHPQHNVKGSKMERVRGLVPYVHNGQLLFHREQTELLDQIRDYPSVPHDDLVDALSYLPVIMPFLGEGHVRRGYTEGRPELHPGDKVLAYEPDDRRYQPSASAQYWETV